MGFRLSLAWRASTVRLLVVSAIVFVGTAGPAAAVDEATDTGSGGPVITSHVDGQQVSGEITVTVASSSPMVWIGWATEMDQPLRYLVPGNGPIPTDQGVATRTLTTSGYYGTNGLIARECTSDAVCEGAQTSVLLEVDNPAPTFDAHEWQDVVYGDHTSINVVDEAPWAWYGFFFDGEYVPPTVDYPWFPADVEHLGGLEHTVQVAYCTPYWRILPPVCDMQHATEVRSFAFLPALHPTVTDVQPRVISPDGNGKADSAAISLTVESPHTLIWQLRRGTERVAVGDYVQQDAGPYTLTVDGLDDQGRPLPSGTYELE